MNYYLNYILGRMHSRRPPGTLFRLCKTNEKIQQKSATIIGKAGKTMKLFGVFFLFILHYYYHKIGKKM